ncbi:CRP-like cAMP-binding protein [Methylohalomonas lacus]|uniref:CRP-like cAMP-binding protein n=1 Tax=Methylohalomonas lacus TaxID=398773 RepID=A0AAE3L5Z9_9GAMM|nr:Crp/Fnr family transcriptional regulator [Methylohalomonas lacus]MCS3904347.1 CRP-like cAMP-binding protein [Methylohalomonas lacus]
MSAALPSATENTLINRLPKKQRSDFIGCCSHVDLPLGTILCERDEPIRQVYFPLDGFISIVEIMDGHNPLEVGLIGNEGMFGSTLTLGINSAIQRAVVQGVGTALCMSTRQFMSELSDSIALQRTLERYIYVMISQLSISAACTHFHGVEKRLARWLLMTHDRAHADKFSLTHKLLADMLGVRRSGVTIAAGALQKKKLISYVRGQITILDRKELEAASCSCYKTIVNDYARILT